MSLKSPLPVLCTLNNKDLVHKQTAFPVEDFRERSSYRWWEFLLDPLYLRRENCSLWHHFTSWMSHGRVANGVFCRKEGVCVCAPTPSRDPRVLFQLFSSVLQIWVNIILGLPLQHKICGHCGVLKESEFRSGWRIIQVNISIILSQALNCSSPQQAKSKNFIGSSWIKEKEEHVLLGNGKLPIFIALSWGDFRALLWETVPWYKSEFGTCLRWSANDILFFRRNMWEESADTEWRGLKIAEGRGLCHVCNLWICFSEEEKRFIA